MSNLLFIVHWGAHTKFLAVETFQCQKLFLTILVVLSLPLRICLLNYSMYTGRETSKRSLWRKAWNKSKLSKPNHSCAEHPCFLHGATPRGSISDLNTAIAVRPTPLSFRILELPVELIDLIFAYIPIQAIVCFRLSCIKFYCYGPPLYELISRCNRRHDLWSTTHAACICKRVTELYRGTVSCIGCKDTHHPSAFTQDQLLNGDGERWCIGSSRRLYWRTGKSVSYQQLARLFEHRLIDRHPILTCKRWLDDKRGPKHPDRDTFLDRVHFGCYRKNKAGGSGLTFFWVIRLAGFPVGQASVEDFERQLTKTRIILCPHMCSNNKNIAFIIRKKYRSYLQGYIMRHGEDTVQCHKCFTYVNIEWGKHCPVAPQLPDAHGIIRLRVTRILGWEDKFRASDPHWIAQSEPCERLEIE